MEIRKLLFILCFLWLLPCANVFAQFDALQINLEKHSIVIGEDQRISLFCDFDGCHYYVVKKASCQNDYSKQETWFKRDGDWIKELEKGEFDEMAEIVLGLSVMNLAFGLNLANLEIVHDPKTILLELVINGQIISYQLNLPLNSNNNKLKQFENICERIIMLANENPDTFLERKGNTPHR
jgi:hypothetical protein